LNRNPYEATQIDAASYEGAEATSVKLSIGATAMKVFFGWERLRLPFNVVFATFVLLLSLPKLSGLLLMGVVVRIVVVANICFFAGSILEILLYFLAIRGRWVRWLLFSIGMFLTMCFVFILLSGVWLPDQE
jgi:hypothetical protein